MVTGWRAQIATVRPCWGLKSGFLNVAQNLEKLDFRKFRLKRSVFCLFGVANPQIGFKTEGVFSYTFGVAPCPVRRVFSPSHETTCFVG